MFASKEAEADNALVSEKCFVRADEKYSGLGLP
jgi:hypothetical protein